MIGFFWTTQNGTGNLLFSTGPLPWVTSIIYPSGPRPSISWCVPMFWSTWNSRRKRQRSWGAWARRGYVEVPSRENEILLPFPFHRWLIGREGDTLVFDTKLNPIPDPGLRNWFHGLSTTVPDFPDLYLRKLHELGNVHGVVWEGTPSLRVGGPAGPVEAEASSPPRDEEIESLRIALHRPMNHPLGRRLLDGVVRGGAGRKKVDLRGLVACPACGHESLEDGVEAWTCGGCGGQYPLIQTGKGVVPFLVA